MSEPIPPTPPAPAPVLTDAERIAALEARLAADEKVYDDHAHPLRRVRGVMGYVAAPFRWVGSKIPNLTVKEGVLTGWLAMLTYMMLAGGVAATGLSSKGCGGILPNPFTPTVDVFPNDGKSRLIVVYDTLDQNTLSAMYSEQVRLYAVANLDEARVFSPATDVSNESELWQKAFAKAKDKKLPYYALVGKKASSDGDLPKSGADMVEVVKHCCGGAKLPTMARPPPSDYVLTKENTIDVRDRKAGLATDRTPMKSKVVQAFDLPEMSDEQINAAITRKDADKSWLSDIRMYGADGKMIPSRDQNGKGYCWAHSSVSAVLCIRAKNFQPYSDLSAYAIACIEKGYRDEGGWGIESLEFIAKRGVPSSAFWPQRSMSPQNDKPATWENAALHKVTVWTQPKTARQFATCLCNNIPVVSDFNWWSHSVCTVRLKSWGTNGNQLKTTIWNSWGDGWSAQGMGDLEGPKALPDDMVAPSVVLAAFAARPQETLYASAP